jgi:hypothetical protein
LLVSFFATIATSRAERPAEPAVPASSKDEQARLSEKDPHLLVVLGHLREIEQPDGTG